MSTDADGGRRAIHPRRGLPSGRAVVGALLITVSAVGAFAVATSAPAGPTTRYVVVVDDVAAGETLDRDDVSFAAMELATSVAAHAVRTLDGVDGAVALRDLRAGELLDARSVRGPLSVDGELVGPVHELTIPVPRNRAPAHVRRGDRVTLLARLDDHTMVTALEHALVLAFETDASGRVASGTATLTVAVPDSGLVSRAALLSHDADDLTIILTTRAIDDVFAAEVRLDNADTVVDDNEYHEHLS